MAGDTEERRGLGSMVQATGVDSDAPLWCSGHENADRWMLRAPGAGRPVTVFVLADPRADERAVAEGSLVRAAFQIIAEALWMETDANVRTTAFIHREERRMLVPAGTIDGVRVIRYLLEDRYPRPIAAWGAAALDVGADGFTLKLLHPDEDEECWSLTAPLAELCGQLVQFLASAGAGCERRDPPSWYVRPAGEEVVPYARLLDALLLQKLADRRNDFVRVDAGEQRAFCDLAIEIAEEHEQPMIHLAALNVAHFAARAGEVRHLGRWRKLLERHLAEPPFEQLSPSFLRSFGRPDAALERARELRRGAGAGYRHAWSPYAEWLDRFLAA